MNKKEIWSACTAHLQTKINSSREHLQALQDASSSETKSSAGDKFETSREMMHQEITKAELHLSQLSKQAAQLNSMSSSLESNVIDRGSFVVSNKGSFYISTALGKVKTEDGFFYAISTDSPMAEALQGKSVGDSTVVNGNKVIVKEVS